MPEKRYAGEMAVVPAAKRSKGEMVSRHLPSRVKACINNQDPLCNVLCHYITYVSFSHSMTLLYDEK